MKRFSRNPLAQVLAHKLQLARWPMPSTLSILTPQLNLTDRCPHLGIWEPRFGRFEHVAYRTTALAAPIQQNVDEFLVEHRVLFTVAGCDVTYNIFQADGKNFSLSAPERRNHRISRFQHHS